jgi:hypothetical protein
MASSLNRKSSKTVSSSECLQAKGPKSNIFLTIMIIFPVILAAFVARPGAQIVSAEATAPQDQINGSVRVPCDPDFPECSFLPVISKRYPRRPINYYGVDVVIPSDLATLAQYHINTAIVSLSAYGNEASWQPFFTEADKNNVNIVVWPVGGGGACGFPFNGTDVSSVYRLLDYLATQERFIGMVIAHEPSWSCLMSVPQMVAIRNGIKDYMRNSHNKAIRIWNYIGHITPFVTSGEIMDVAVTWQHCFGGAEGSCPHAMDLIHGDRATIESKGWHHMDLVYLFQTFEIAGAGYRMPTADEMYNWACQILGTNQIDGFFWYTWRNPAGYSQVLIDRPDLWSMMRRVYEDCIE